MNVKKILMITGYLMVTGCTITFVTSCKSNRDTDILVVTRVPVASYHPDTLPVYPGAALVGFVPGKEQDGGSNLTPGFFSACAPHVSYDGKHILFTGQKKEGDPWQVWELNIKKKESRQLTDFRESCFTPYYLPGDRMVFSREMPDTGTGTFLTLFTMNLDGTDLQQITFHPNDDLITTILKDGRILMNSKQIYPEEGPVKCLAMRPNGTKEELFYKGNPASTTGFRVHETENGLIWFTEQNGTRAKKDIISIRYNRPLHSQTNYTADIPGSFYDELPADSGSLIVSYRAPESQNIALYSFSVKDRKIEKTLASDPQFHYLDPVRARAYQRPRNLPNELLASHPTGLFMAQNINVSADMPENGSATPKATYIEILGMDKNLGIVPVEEDGSFYLKIPADIPFRFQTLDENEEVVFGPSDWYWVRPFERRGCIGCHEDPELAPENIVPLAINHFPVTLPLDSSRMLKRSETFKLGDFHR